MSVMTDLAKAVVSQLNKGGFSPSFTAFYSVRPCFELSELDRLQVAVVPKSLEIHAVSRADSRYIATVDIGISQRIGNKTPEEAVASLGTLVDEIAEYLIATPPDEFREARFQGIGYEPIYIPDHLNGQRIFTSVLNVKYMMLG